MRGVICAGALAAGCLLGGCQPSQQAAAPAAACALTAGWDPWEPYQFENPPGEVRGVDIEIAALLARDAGCTLTFVRGNWLDQLHQLRDGRVQLLLAATVVPEREEYARFSNSYRQESFALYVRAEDLPALKNLGVKGFAELGRRIGYTEGYFYGPEVNHLIELSAADRASKRFVPASLGELNYARLLDRDIDALLDDPFVAGALLRREGWAGHIVRHPFSVSSAQVSFMFSREAVAPEVVERFNDALARRQNDGSISKILAKYR